MRCVSLALAYVVWRCSYCTSCVTRPRSSACRADDLRLRCRYLTRPPAMMCWRWRRLRVCVYNLRAALSYLRIVYGQLRSCRKRKGEKMSRGLLSAVVAGSAAGVWWFSVFSLLVVLAARAKFLGARVGRAEATRRKSRPQLLGTSYARSTTDLVSTHAQAANQRHCAAHSIETVQKSLLRVVEVAECKFASFLHSFFRIQSRPTLGFYRQR